MGEETENEVFVYVCRGISVRLLRDRRKKKPHILTLILKGSSYSFQYIYFALILTL